MKRERPKKSIDAWAKWKKFASVYNWADLEMAIADKPFLQQYLYQLAYRIARLMLDIEICKSELENNKAILKYARREFKKYSFR